MKNQTFRIRFYSVFFIILVLSTFFSQALFATAISFDTISNDFLSRKELIKFYNNFKYKLGDRVFTNMVVGKDGWLFFTGDMSIQDYQKTSPMGVGNIKRLADIINQFKETTEENSGVFLLVIPPDKSTIYPQYMPDEIPVIGEISSLDRFIEYLHKYTNVDVIDLRSRFGVASVSREIYYKTDSHWNCYGAGYAYDEIISHLSAPYPHLSAYSSFEFVVENSDGTLLDLASLMGLNIPESATAAIPKFNVEVLPVSRYDSKYNDPSLRVVETDNINSPDLMIFHDSFYTTCLDYFIESTFSRTVAVPYGESKLSTLLEMIESEKSNVVILEFVERQMEYFYRHLYE